MNKTFVISIAALSLFIASPVLAATFSAGQSYTLDKQTIVNDDLYAAAGSPIISGTILGDAIVAGGNVTFTGSTKSSLMAAGGTITVLGTVGASVRAVGGTITLSGPVGGDVVAVGGTISIVQTATVGRDVALAGGSINFDGTAARNATMRGGTVVIDGTINGNVDVQASQSVTLGPNARIKGNLSYTAPVQLTKDPGATVLGTTNYTPTHVSPANNFDAAGIVAGFIGLLFIIKLLAIGTAVIIATTLFNRTVSGLALSTLGAFWKDLCIGFAALILVPIVCILLFVSVFGLTFAALGMIVYALLIITGRVLAPIVAGALLTRWIYKEEIIDWKWSLLGLIVLDIIGAVPVVGWVIPFVFFLAALGTLAARAWQLIAQLR